MDAQEFERVAARELGERAILELAERFKTSSQPPHVFQGPAGDITLPGRFELRGRSGRRVIRIDGEVFPYATCGPVTCEAGVDGTQHVTLTLVVSEFEARP